MTLPTTIPLLGWTWNDLLFLVLAAVLVGTALMVVLGRNIIRSGLWLILCFATLAGLYVLLGNPLVAVAQVLVYMGAIAVLILFAIMLTQTKGGPAALVFHHQAWAAAIAALVLGAVLAIVDGVSGWPLVGPFMRTSTELVATLVFSDFLLAFEIVGVLLLAAVIGGVFLAKREDDQPEQQV
ncbi:MAG: NADH-quinone oxidoreductase subunit J [Candidatus Limnocylindrales bacterium]